MASEAVFSNESSPVAAVLVGNASDPAGTIEIQDVLFTSIGNLPGLVMVVWAAQSITLGSCAMWGNWAPVISLKVFLVNIL